MRALLALVAAAALAGCGGPADSPASPDKDVAAPGRGMPVPPDPAASVVCAERAVAVPLPTAVPQVPLPSEAVLTSTEQRSGDRLVLTAVTPGTFREALTFMQKAYPAAGLALEEGEVEEHDAESNYRGNGLTGRWTLREIPGCDGDTLVTVLVAKA